MGYGDVYNTKKTHDGGVDGEIIQDKLALDKAYFQGKRYINTTVGRPEVQKFVGALNSKKCKKGAFITTSQFSKQVKEYIKKIDVTVILIDGKELAKHLYDYNLGVKTKEVFEHKELDKDFFKNISSLNFEKVA